MFPTKFLQVLQLWALALAISAALVAAGQRWSEPPPIGDALVWSLLLVPSLLLVLLLLGRWTLPAGTASILTGQGGESDDSNQEQD